MGCRRVSTHHNHHTRDDDDTILANRPAYASAIAARALQSIIEFKPATPRRPQHNHPPPSTQKTVRGYVHASASAGKSAFLEGDGGVAATHGRAEPTNDVLCLVLHSCNCACVVLYGGSKRKSCLSRKFTSNHMVRRCLMWPRLCWSGELDCVCGVCTWTICVVCVCVRYTTHHMSMLYAIHGVYYTRVDRFHLWLHIGILWPQFCIFYTYLNGPEHVVSLYTWGIYKGIHTRT